MICLIINRPKKQIEVRNLLKFIKKRIKIIIFKSIKIEK